MARSQYNAKQLKTREKVRSRFKLVAFKKKASLQSSSSSSLASSSSSPSLFASLFGAEEQFFDTHERLIDLRTVTHCMQCGSQFTFFTKKQQCPTCRRIVCAKCLDPLKYALPTNAADDDDEDAAPKATASAAAQDDVRVVVCVLCCKLLRRHKALREYRTVRASARDAAVVRAYATLRALRSAIDSTMPAFRGLVFSLTGTGEGHAAPMSAAEVVAMMDVDNLYYLQQRAKEQLTALERQFRQLEDRLARTQENEAGPNAKASEVALRGKIKYAAIDFLRRALPEYKVLAEQLRRFLALPEISGVLENYALNKARVQAEEAREEQLQKRLAEHKRLLEGHTASSSSTSAFSSSPSSSTNPFATGSSVLDVIRPGPAANTHKGPLSSLSVAGRSPIEVSAGSAFLEAATASALATSPSYSNSNSNSSSNSHSHSKSNPNSSPPVITMVKPAIVPLRGGVSVTVQGEHFTAPCSVRIGGALCERVQTLAAAPGSSQCALLVRVPSLREVGPQSLLVTSADGQRAELEGVLFATDDEAFIADLYKKDAASNNNINNNNNHGRY